MRNGLKKQIISGLFWKFGERILAQGVSFIVSLVLARMLLPEEYGSVALVLVFINLAKFGNINADVNHEVVPPFHKV